MKAWLLKRSQQVLAEESVTEEMLVAAINAGEKPEGVVVVVDSVLVTPATFCSSRGHSLALETCLAAPPEGAPRLQSKPTCVLRQAGKWS